MPARLRHVWRPFQRDTRRCWIIFLVFWQKGSNRAAVCSSAVGTWVRAPALANRFEGRTRSVQSQPRKWRELYSRLDNNLFRAGMGLVFQRVEGCAIGQERVQPVVSS